MDAINGSGAGEVAVMAASLQRQTFGAQVVSKTLDYMNQGSSSMGMGGNADYDFQTKVLTAGFMNRGPLVDDNV